MAPQLRGDTWTHRCPKRADTCCSLVAMAGRPPSPVPSFPPPQASPRLPIPLPGPFWGGSAAWWGHSRQRLPSAEAGVLTDRSEPRRAAPGTALWKVGGVAIERALAAAPQRCSQLESSSSSRLGREARLLGLLLSSLCFWRQAWFLPARSLQLSAGARGHPTVGGGLAATLGPFPSAVRHQPWFTQAEQPVMKERTP